MILFIDTSSSTATVALIDGGRESETSMSARSDALVPYLRRVVEENPDVDRVVVVTGPGSFTGLRVGASFALGLAVGRNIPIIPLGSLELQAARSDSPVTAVVEAGRGRFYFKVGDGDPGLGAPDDIPRTLELAGTPSERGREALVAAGHRFRPEAGLRPVAGAARRLLETASEVGYQSLKLDYMQSFTVRA